MLWTRNEVEKGQVAQTLTRNRWIKTGPFPRIFPNPPGGNLAGSIQNRGPPALPVPRVDKRKQTPWQTVEDTGIADRGPGAGHQAAPKSWFASGGPTVAL